MRPRRTDLVQPCTVSLCELRVSLEETDYLHSTLVILFGTSHSSLSWSKRLSMRRVCQVG